MEDFIGKDLIQKSVRKLTTYPVPFAIDEVKSNPRDSNDKLIISKALEFHSAGDINQAFKLYKSLFDKGIFHPLVLSNLGAIYQQSGKVEEAEIIYKKSINKFPNSPFAYSNYAILLKAKGELSLAEINQRQAIQLKPDFAEAHYNLGNTLKEIGKLNDAENSLRKAIELKPNYAEAYYNLGNTLKEIGKLNDAENSLRKATELKPDYAEAYNNLGNIQKEIGEVDLAIKSFKKAIKLKSNFVEAYSNIGCVYKDIGKLNEAEGFFRRAININPDVARPYFNISTLNVTNSSDWQAYLFSNKILRNISASGQIDIYFARSNVLHQQKRYEESAKYLELANQKKLLGSPSNANILLKKTNYLLEKTALLNENKEDKIDLNENIFIVGMPRSGSTLVESIISMNFDVKDLGETNIFEESFLEWEASLSDVNQQKNINELYKTMIEDNFGTSRITTNKLLYNYQYVGIIASQLSNVKIIHCFREPLDNILSIYRTHFATGNEFASSLVGCAKVYLDQYNIMKYYKKHYSSKIFNLNYDLLVTNPNREIRSLISWLGWDWNDSYLLPHLNQRSVFTASNVQVRSPIHSRSIGGWKNYRNMLLPALEIIKDI